MTLADVKYDVSAFLIHEYAGESLDEWLEQHYLTLFENVLEAWYVHPPLWPKDRTLALFKA